MIESFAEINSVKSSVDFFIMSVMWVVIRPVTINSAG